MVQPTSLETSKKVSRPSNIVYFVMKKLFLFATLQTKFYKDNEELNVEKNIYLSVFKTIFQQEEK